MTDYRALARQAAQAAGIDADLFERQIGAESGFNPNAQSPAGARGIAQIMPATAKGWGVNPMDPRAALFESARRMRQYSDQYGGYRNALVAYNAGPGRVGKPLYSETENYINKIMGGSTPSAQPSSAATTGVSAAPMDRRTRLLESIFKGTPYEGLAAQRAARQQPEAPTSGGAAGDGHDHGSSGSDASAGSGSAASGEIIGRPYQGTHSLGNWQSDRAIDVSYPVGTPLYAVSDGVISKTGGSAGGGDRFAGYNATLTGGNNAYWYGHLSRLAVQPGTQVRRGQLIGYSGSANGVPHLHFGQQHGNVHYGY